MNESILNSIKKLLGPDSSYTVFDPDIIIHINSVFSVLHQLGVGPSEGFSISGDTETWSDFIGDDKRLNDVKTYVYIKVRMVFDPPSSSFVLKNLEDLSKELEWRLNVAVDPGGY